MNDRTHLQQVGLELRIKTDIRYAAEFCRLPPLPPHAVLFSEILRDGQARGEPTGILAAVGHLKSTVLNLMKLQDLIDPDPHILFAARSHDVMLDTAGEVRRQVKRLWGEEGPLWKAHKFTTPRAIPHKFPSFLGATTNMGIEGNRADKAYLDDPIDRTSEKSKVYREDAIDWYNKEFRTRFNKGCTLSFIGSPWHPDDLYMSLIRRGSKVHCFPMISMPEPKLYQQFDNVHWHGEEYESGYLWTEQWAGADMDRVRREMGGTIPYRQRCLVDPQAILGDRFEPDWFGDWNFDSVSLDPIRDRLRIEFGVDLAISKKKIADNSAISIIGVDEVNNVIYVLDCVAGQWNAVELERELIKQGKKWKPVRVTIEHVADQKARVEYLTKNTWLPIIGQDSIGDKGARIDTLAVPIETGRIRFRHGLDDMEEEFMYFPNGTNDDRADSLEVAVRHIINVMDRPDYTPLMG